MLYQQKLSATKFGDSQRDLTLKKMEIIPFAIIECSELCSCEICLKGKQSSMQPEKRIEKIQKQPRQRRLSICEFKDDLLAACLMLQKHDSVVRPLNVNIIDTVILKDREYTIYVYYENGLRFIKTKSFFHAEMESFLIERKIEFEIDYQIRLITAGIHPSIRSEEYHDNVAQITTRLKQRISDSIQNQSILVARYQTGETILMKKFELHQLVVLSKTNQVFDSLLHLQLYLYNEKQALNSIENNKRNPKDYFIHKHRYVKDKKMFSDIVCEQSYLTDPSLRGQRQWDNEKKYSDTLQLQEYFKYTCHKIAVYIQSFHRLCITDMEVHFTVNCDKNVSIVNIIGLKTQKAEESQWVIKTGRTLSTAEKIQINDVNLNEQDNTYATERSRLISKNLVPFTQKIIEKIRPITSQVIENNKQNTRTQEAFQSLNPTVNSSISEILNKQNYQKLIQNFPKQLKRYQSMQKEPQIKSRIDEQQLTTSRESMLEDYLVRSRQRKKKSVVISPFLRTISRRFFSRRNSADFL